MGIGCYRGSENDVMNRVIGAAESAGAERQLGYVAVWDCQL